MTTVATNNFIGAVRERVGQVVVGQETVVERALVALLTGGHLLLQGVPGIGKTLLVNALANAVDLKFSRVQFTIGNVTNVLPAPFLVIATQNPIEQSGTFELPEAQLDRFMLCHRLVYPSVEEEEGIVNQQLSLGLRIEKEGAVPKSAFDMFTEAPVRHINDLTEAMGKVQEVHVSDVFKRQSIELVRRTREHRNLEIGSSPRAGMALVQAARARAFIHDRDYAIPEDLFALAEDVVLHRIRLTYGALAEGATGADTLKEILVGIG